MIFFPEIITIRLDLYLIHVAHSSSDLVVLFLIYLTWHHCS